MGDVLSPFTITTPPPPSSPSNENNSMVILYYGLVVVGTAAIVLAIYNIIIIKRCHNRRHSNQPPQPNSLVEGVPDSESRSFDNPHRNLLSSFKYKKEVISTKDLEEQQQGGVAGGGGGGGGDDYDCECPVCLSVYEEGEEVRKLPRCKHSFHAPCIDMWLYSHFDCPICRTPVAVGPMCHGFPAEDSRGESDGVPV
ncbi:RING-H2 finger protein ATL16-like [Lotus japonicus]|uniref:RING-H2 finger protein ATL16-like n=1 Tax=Lotus japonicus TaxID=34305 RepID=UPI00258FEB5B|nr:RING-H2 finger protein ATL16-like [Lotus japonicus]